PTAASAAATVITIKTNSWPDTSRKKLEKATNVRFTALSINSMHMNIEMTLRLISTPTTPIVNSTADNARKHESCGTIKTEVRIQRSGPQYFSYQSSSEACRSLSTPNERTASSVEWVATAVSSPGSRRSSNSLEKT